MKAIALSLLGLTLAGCLLDDPLHPGEPELGESTAELTGTANPVDCGYADGRTCKSTQPLGHNVRDVVKWDPCFGGNFTWTAIVSLELDWDRACVGGIATAGKTGGCSAGTKLEGDAIFSGAASGAVTLSVATDGSIPSPGITSLTATCDEPLYVGVFRASAAGAGQQFVEGVDWNVFNIAWSYRSSHGQRLSQLEAWYDTDGTTRFDGVFVPGSGGYGLNAGMTLAQLRAQKDANHANGMELSDVDALQTANGVAYVGVWRAGTRVQEIYDGPVANFWAWSTPYTNQGYQPTIVESYYDARNVHRYTVVMTLTPGSSGWTSAVGLEYGAFAREWRKYRDQGWQLSQLETHVKNGVRYYDGFFLPGSADEDFVPGARAGEFYPALTRNTGAGLELIDFDRAKLGRTTTDPLREERLARTEYPVVSPVWMAEAMQAFWTAFGADPIGFTVALMKDGRLIGASSFGNAQTDADGGAVRMTPNAQWDYLSVSKFITTLAAAKVAEEQEIDIANTLLIPAIASKLGITVPVTSNPKDFWHITVKQAMNHTSNLKDGGCPQTPGAGWPLSEGGTTSPGPSMQNPTGSGPYNYSGFDACFLRMWVEVKTGMDFERYIDTHVFRPNGIHNLDCDIDPEKVQVMQYRDPFDNGPGTKDPDAPYCAPAGFKGTPLQMLQILQAVRTPGKLFGLPMLIEMRGSSTNPGDEWTFYQTAGVWPTTYGYSMTGGRSGMRTHIAQFPNQPFSGLSPFSVYGYHSGVDAVFFTNSSGLDGGPQADGVMAQWLSMAADPNP